MNIKASTTVATFPVTVVEGKERQVKIREQKANKRNGP